MTDEKSVVVLGVRGEPLRRSVRLVENLRTRSTPKVFTVFVNNL